MIVKTQFNKIKEILIEKYSENNELIARACLIIRERPDNQGRVAMLEDVWTNPDFRNQGHCKEILKEVIKVSKEEGCYKCILACRTALIELYSKFGWNKYEHSMRLNLNKKEI